MRIPGISYGNVTATVALIVALGGTSYAAVTITGSSVKDSSLTGADIKNSSLTSSDIKNASLLASDFKAGQLPAGPAGAAGPAGPAGATGPQGPAGATDVITRRQDQTIPASSNLGTTVQCETGEVAVGGGAGITGPLDQTAIFSSEPRESDGSAPEDGDVSTGWRGTGINGTAIPQVMNVYVLCASP
jgi:hypothetical protein